LNIKPDTSITKRQLIAELPFSYALLVYNH